MAANALGHELCERCGTRLMLVVEPSALRFEEAGSDAGQNEYLLERISTLENNLLRLADRLEKMLDLMLRRTRASQQEQLLIETLIETLAAAGTINERRLRRQWVERCEREMHEVERAERHRELRARVLAAYGGEERPAFTQLINEGFDLIERGAAARGTRLLERAAAFAPDNSPLNFYLGTHFFQLEKRTLARSYFERAYASDPEEPRVCLLLGLLAGDAGEIERARALLTKAVARDGASFAAHYALGRLAAAEADWRTALAEFKSALSARPSPEAHYVVALASQHLGRARTALRHLLKAVEMDADYSEAFYLLGVVYLSLDEQAEAAKALAAARAADPENPLYRAAAGRRRGRREALPAPSLFGQAGADRRRLLTGGDRRLAVVLQQDAIERAAAR